MRHDVDWVQRTYDAMKHLHDNIVQPIVFRGGMILKTRCGESFCCHLNRR